MKRIYFDIETRSPCDLKKCGADVYARHPETEILCVAFKNPFALSPLLWHPFNGVRFFVPPKYNQTTELKDSIVRHIKSGGEMIAHNAAFDVAIWNEVGVKKHGFPPLAIEQVRDSMAQCCAQALPASLSGAGDALRVPVVKGDPSVMRKMAKGAFSPDLFSQLLEYCGRDVLALEAIDTYLEPLQPQEREVFLANWRCNQRGLKLDTELIEAVHRANALADLDLEDMALSKGLSPSLLRSQQQFRAWALTQGVELPDLNKKTLGALKIDNPVVEEALALREQVCRSSIKKFEAMENHLCPDGRARGNHVYHRATTGRFAGSGIQVQNMPRPAVKDTDELAEKILCGESLEGYGLPVKTLLSSSVRPCIVPEEGHEFLCADYSSIEARVLFWLSGCAKGLRVFTEGADLYCVTAEGIYGHPVNKEEHPEERLIGKIASLSLGYQGAAGAFQGMCDAYKVDSSGLDIAGIVEGYRSTYPEVVDFWARCQAEAMEAMEKRGERVGSFKYSERVDALGAYLPSGRVIVWNRPSIGENQWGRPCIKYMGIGRNRKWMELSTYGGDLAQSLTQGTARDLLAHALVQLDKQGWHPVLHVHDEIMCEEPVGSRTVAELEGIMCDLPPWAQGLPVEAEGWVGRRYSK